MIKSRRLFLLLCLSLCLSACSQTTDLRFYTNESWKFDTRIQYDEGLIDLFGQVISSAVGSELGIPFIAPRASSAMDMMGIFFNKAKAEYRKQGIGFNWRKSGDTFIIDVKGDSLQKFNQFSSGLAKVERFGDGRYHLQMDVITLGELDPSLEEYSELTDAFFAYTFTLHAGQIDSSNANEQSTTKAVWYNPSQIDVTFYPTLPISWGWALGGCGAITLVLSISIGFMQKFRMPCPYCRRRNRAGAEICSNCGRYLGGWGNEV